jgi:hypothetical protein
MCQDVGHKACLVCNLNKQACKFNGKSLNPPIPRGANRAKVEEVVNVDESESEEDDEDDEDEEEEEDTEMETGRGLRKIQSQTTSAKASAKSFEMIDCEIVGKFGNMTIPGIEEFYASQAPRDRLTVVQDTVVVTRIMQFVMNAWMDKFYEAVEIEMAELDAMKKWKGKLPAKTSSFKDPESAADPSDSGLLTGSFSDFQSNPNVSIKAGHALNEDGTPLDPFSKDDELKARAAKRMQCFGSPETISRKKLQTLRDKAGADDKKEGGSKRRN